MSGARGARLVRGALLAMLVLVPLAPNPGLFTNADLPKRVVLLGGALLVLLLVLWRAARSKAETKVPVPENLSLLSVAVAAGLLVAPRAPDAGLTLLRLAELGALSALGLLAARFLADGDGPRRVTIALLGAAAVTALLGTIGWPAGRSSVFGNPSFAAEFVAGALPLAYVFLRSRGWALGAVAVAVALSLAFLGLAKSRADWLGLLAGVGVVAVLVFLARRRRRLPAGPAAAVLLAGILALPFAIDALPLPLFGRSDTVEVRRHVRQATLEMALDHPAAGVGLGGFRAAYPEYRHPEETELSLEREVTFPHHLPLLVFAETGALGLAALLAFLWSVLFAGIRTALSRPEDAFAPAATGAIVAILVSAQFSAPLLHPGSAILFFSLVGLLAARRPRRFVTRLSGRYRRSVPVLILLAPVAAGAVLLPPRLQADRLYRKAVAIEEEAGGAMDERVEELLKSSVAAAPTPEAYRQLAFYLTATDRPEQALARLDRLFAIAPHDVAGRLERARALLVLERYDDARAILVTLSERRPGDDTIRFLAGLAALRSDEPAGGLPHLLGGLREMPPEAARRNAKVAARALPGELWDSFLAQVALWPETETSLAVLSVFGSGYGDYYRAVVFAREDRLDEAMEALRIAVRAGVADADRLEFDPRLAPLRSRADFRRLRPR